MNPLIQLKTITSPLLITLTLLCFGLFPKAQAVVPPPDGGYPNFTTAEGQNALLSLTTGAANTAVGWYSLFSNTEGSFNTARRGGAAQIQHERQDNNTAIGAATLLFNTTGCGNTAVGAAALLNKRRHRATQQAVIALPNKTTGELSTRPTVDASALQQHDRQRQHGYRCGSALQHHRQRNIALGSKAGCNNYHGSQYRHLQRCPCWRVGNRIGRRNSTRTCSRHSWNATGIASHTVTTTPTEAGHGKFLARDTNTRLSRWTKPAKRSGHSSQSSSGTRVNRHRGTRSLALIAEEVAQVNPDLVGATRGEIRPLRGGERDVAQRVSQRASQGRGTGSGHSGINKTEIASLTATRKSRPFKFKK